MIWSKRQSGRQVVVVGDGKFICLVYYIGHFVTYVREESQKGSLTLKSLCYYELDCVL